MPEKANPEDTSLALAEANLYLETKDFETYKKNNCRNFGEKSKRCQLGF